jgi:hypothetical protein
MRVKARWITQEVLQITCKCKNKWVYRGSKEIPFIVNCHKCDSKLKIIGVEDKPIEVKGIDKVV